MALARGGKQRAWWQEYALPYATYVGLEAEAISISDYHSHLIAGLLQVESYAREIFKVAEPPLDAAIIEQRVEARIRRQVLLTQDSGPLFHAILDEGALRRPVGGANVMQAQMQRIIEVASLPKVTFQVIPLGIGAHPGMDSNFAILGFEESTVNDVVYVEGLIGNLYLENAAELERYKRIFTRLGSIALSHDDSIALVAEIEATCERI